jgi:holo-[acyl-carrier protein] synthase
MTGRPPAGIGLDLLEIDRLEAALARRPTLAERLLTDGERAYAAARSRPGQHLAVRFCAKEAVAKALKLDAWSWRDIEVVSDGGAPRIVLHGALAGRAEIEVSLTHSRGTAGAVAMVRA